MKRFLVLLLVWVTLPVFLQAQNPEPSGWYAGDMHVHRSCGGAPESVSSLYNQMTTNNLGAISLLADMGNGEVQDPDTDLPLVNGQDASVSTSAKVVRWDAEWHWDPTYTQYAHQALGGHIVGLGLTKAQQIWQEYTFPILDWAHQQGGIAGFAHMQYLDGNFPASLTCCTPIEYPVEVALGAADFISEDVANSGSNVSGMNPEAAIQAYYKLLNSGFRPSFVAGTDYPCNDSRPLGSLLTYAQPADGQMSYNAWINAIRNGRTVVSRNGHNEFLSLVVNGSATPGDQIDLATAGSVQVSIEWTAAQDLTGTIELVYNGNVIASQAASAGPGQPATLTAPVNFAKSGWLAARRMGADGHQVHTAAVFVIVNNAPIRASVNDAQYYSDWTGSLLTNTSAGGPWNSFFPTSLSAAQARYSAAQALYRQIAAEAQASPNTPTLTSIAVTPSDRTIPSGSTLPLTATGNYSDGSTLNLTAQVTWTSADTGIATANPRGLILASGFGTTQISAKLGNIVGSTSLTVQGTPVTITTNSLPTGTTNTAYSATLQAQGGVLPYTWSVVSGGILPAGMTLSNSGQLSGTPTTSGLGNVTFQVSDANGNETSRTFNLTINAAIPSSAPAVDGPGGPILVITSSANPFSTYYSEILRAEGLNEFTVIDISQISASTIANFDVAVLGDFPLTAEQVTILSNWVSGGGNLIAMHPDSQLTTMLGLVDTGSALSDAYLRIDPSSAAGAGLVNETIQFHGAAQRYTLTGATSLATLYEDSSTSTAFPAVTLTTYGSGRAAAFAYDLARSVVYTRQGNPAWSGQHRIPASISGGSIRPSDLFYGASGGDLQPDWVDLNKVAIPQADEQQRLLANLLIQMNLQSKPLPRFWYLPRGLKAAVVMTGDDHRDGSGAISRFETYLADSAANCSVDKWECVRSTAYVYVPVGGTSGTLSDTIAAQFTSQGFEVALHVTTDCSDWTSDTGTATSLADLYTKQLADFGQFYTHIPAPRTNRTHCITWSNYDWQPQVELSDKIRFDTNYYYWPSNWLNDQPGMFTGSGMPMRFAKADGSLVDVYQATTQMTDESGQTYPKNIDTLLDNAVGDKGYYGVFTANMHSDNPISEGANAIVGSAQQRGVPVVSSLQMLTWIDGRNKSSFGNLSWDGTKLNFTISLAAGASQSDGTDWTHAMLPALSLTGRLSNIRSNSNSVAYTIQSIKGIDYAIFNANTGSYVATYSPDTTAPLISSISGAATSATTATVTWSTDESSTSTVMYGTSANNLNLQANTSGLTSAHTVNLTSLAPYTTYYFRVSSSDAFGNTSVAPSTANSFQTPTAPLTDSSTSDFASGTGTCSAVQSTTGGEIILPPAVDAEFTGANLPTNWTSNRWSSTGSVAVANGAATVDGADISSTESYGSGVSLQFAATFTGDRFQYVGFAASSQVDPPWIMFGTTNGGTLYARVSQGGTDTGTNTVIPGSWFNAPHRYQIDRKTNSIDFYIDGKLVATQTASIAANMVLVASDLLPGAGTVAVKWMRLSPYADSCSFTSRVLDAGASVTWGTFNWTSDVPAGTSLAVSFRTGNTPTLDSSWTTLQEMPSSGAAVGGTFRYFQYLAELATSAPNNTPALTGVSLEYTHTVDTTPPQITAQSPASGSTDVPVGTSVSVTFNKVINAATVNNSTFRLRAQGANADVPATVSYSGQTAKLVPTEALSTLTTYDVRLSGPIADLNGNRLAKTTWSFTTSPYSLSHVETTLADFGAGTSNGCSVAVHSGDGEVTLTPIADQEFLGTTLPNGWTSVPWSSGGAATVANGAVAVNGTLFASTAFYSVGRSLEFVATFQGEQYQHAGLGQNLSSVSEQWAMFSTSATASQLYARTNNNGNTDEFAIPAPSSGSWLGTPHRFRIDWLTSSVVYSIDGTVVHTSRVVLDASQTLRPLFNDYSPNGTSLSVDWLLLTPYNSSCVFGSAVFDAGARADWGNLSWNAITPTNTTLTLKYRTGDTPNPSDGTWTAFAQLSPGQATNVAAVAGSARYFQYEADLGTSDENQTPVLDDVTLAYNISKQQPPQVSNPGPQNSSEGSVIALQVNATDPQGETLTYSATGLPAGLSINASTGLISGTVAYTAAATNSGIYNVSVTVSDTVPLSTTVLFNWTVTNALAQSVGVLTISKTSATYGEAVTLTDTIPVVGGLAPTGLVSFYNNGTTLIGTATPNAAGVATLTTTTLPAGNNSLTAVLAPDDHYAQTTSNALMLKVHDFSLAASPGNQAINRGDQVSYVISLSGITIPFDSPVTLTASDLPPGATVSFSQASFVPGTGPTSATMTITTTRSQALFRSDSRSLEICYGILLFPLLGIRKIRRKLQGTLGNAVYFIALFVLLAGIGAATGCGGSSAEATPHQYTITVTATSGSLSHATNVTLTIR